MKQINLLQRLPDGSFIDWGRHATVNGVRGEGGAVLYQGEAAEVMRVLLHYQKPACFQHRSGAFSR